LIATLANSLTEHAPILQIPLPFLEPYIPQRLIPLINLLFIILILYVMYKLFRNTKIARKLTNILRRNIVKRNMLQPVSFHELLIATGGYGVLKFEIEPGSPAADKTPCDLDLSKHDIYILAIQRGLRTIPMPAADTRILKNDSVICFGKLQDIKKVLLPTGPELGPAAS
jgi:hypothetical protein